MAAPTPPDMTASLRRLTLALAGSFFCLALAAGYWSGPRAPSLLARADNPRRLLAERRAPRGPILDRQGQVLAESTGAPGSLTRHYPYPALAPVIGYVSLLYGSAGMEAAADGVLHGDEGQNPLALAWSEAVLGAPPTGRAIRLSIDLRLQALADEQLGTSAGAVVLLKADTGEILALASHPTYDANQMEDTWQDLVSDPAAPLLNRATLALYQPGGVLAPVILAGALEAGLADLGAPYPQADAELGVGDLVLGCREAPPAESLTLADALQLGCPWPFADLGGQLGARALGQLFRDFRFDQAPALPIPATAARLPQLPLEANAAAIGQGSLTLTPLHVALATAAIANRGQLPAPHLLLAAQAPGGAWQAVPPETHPIAALPTAAANQVKALLAEGHQAIALSGPEGRPVAWYAGFAPFTQTRYAVAVVLESGEVGAVTEIGRALLEAAAEAGP